MKNMERFVNFSDGVMAIAVTLLVLPLAERASNARINSYHDFQAAFAHQLAIFFLSFVVICRYWEVHHNLFSSLKTFSALLFWLNAAWLASIVLVPFTSEIIGNASGTNAFTTAVYIGSLLITSYIGVAIQWVIVQSPQLRKPGVLAPSRLLYGATSAVAMTAAFVLSVLVPSIGPWSLLLLIPAGYVAKYWPAQLKHNLS